MAPPERFFAAFFSWIISSWREDEPRRRPSPAPEVEVRVDLRGRDAGVAEHFLHRAQILRGLQQVAGE